MLCEACQAEGRRAPVAPTGAVRGACANGCLCAGDSSRLSWPGQAVLVCAACCRQYGYCELCGRKTESARRVLERLASVSDA